MSRRCVLVTLSVRMAEGSWLAGWLGEWCHACAGPLRIVLVLFTRRRRAVREGEERDNYVADDRLSPGRVSSRGSYRREVVGSLCVWTLERMRGC